MCIYCIPNGIDYMSHAQPIEAARAALTAFEIHDICQAYELGKSRGINPFLPGTDEQIAFALGSGAIAILEYPPTEVAE